MSITLHIEDDNENYEIIAWRYQVRKDIDSKGRGSAKPIIENFILKIENGRLETIMTWVTTPQLYKSRIYIIEDPTQSKGRKVTTEFVDVRCTNYELGMDGVYLELNAAGFRREDVAYESYWKTTTFSADQSTEVTTREEEEEESVFNVVKTNTKAKPTPDKKNTVSSPSQPIKTPSDKEISTPNNSVGEETKDKIIKTATTVLMIGTVAFNLYQDAKSIQKITKKVNTILKKI